VSNVGDVTYRHLLAVGAGCVHCRSKKHLEAVALLREVLRADEGGDMDVGDVDLLLGGHDEGAAGVGGGGADKQGGQSVSQQGKKGKGKNKKKKKGGR
jgi:hypothetical protein